MLRRVAFVLRWVTCVVLAAVMAATFAQSSDARNRIKPSIKGGLTKAPPAKGINAADINVDDPMLVVVSIKRQRMEVYRGSTLIAKTVVSTGRKGYATPTGIFSIIQKKRFHRSNIYRGAPMPYMQRVTWSGIALHAGVVPGYPASHGCIRLPRRFATKLYGMTEPGVHVLVVPDGVALSPVEHALLPQPPAPALLTAPQVPSLASAPEPATLIRVADASSPAVTLAPSSEGTATPADPALDLPGLDAELARQQAYEQRSRLPVRILVTRRTGRERLKDVQQMLAELGFDPGEIDGWMGTDTGKAIQAFQDSIGIPPTGMFTAELVEQLYAATGRGDVIDGHIYVRQNFKPVFDAPIRITDPDRPLGTHLYIAKDFDDGDSRAQWLSVALDGDKSSGTDTLDRIDLPDDIRERLSAMLVPGSSMVISDDGLSGLTAPAPKGGSDFVVLLDD